MNRAGISEGTFVICVPYFMARSNWQHEDVVVVERRRGQIIERTVKRLRLIERGAELWPESDDPRFQQPVFIAQTADCTKMTGPKLKLLGW